LLRRGASELRLLRRGASELRLLRRGASELHLIKGPREKSTMPVRANIDPKYTRQFLVTAGVFFAFALWFAYDGYVAYPKERARALAYQRLKMQDRLDEWEETAAEHGWSTKKPEKFEPLFELDDPSMLEEAQEKLEEEHNTDIAIQRWLGGVAALPGLWFVVGFFRVRGRWIEMDENGLRSSRGRQLEFGQIETLDKKKWRSKGIAKVNYRTNGSRRRLVLDDWKYDREATEQILRGVESHLADEQIVRGTREPPPGEEGEEPEEVDEEREEAATEDDREST